MKPAVWKEVKPPYFVTTRWFGVIKEGKGVNRLQVLCITFDLHDHENTGSLNNNCKNNVNVDVFSGWCEGKFVVVAKVKLFGFSIKKQEKSQLESKNNNELILKQK